jgi:uncharacterized protein (TIGR03083 family)
MTSRTPDVDVLRVLHDSHDRLVATLDGLSDEQAAAQSYDDDWSIGQVASHLASGAEVFTLFLGAGRDGTPAPGVEAMQPIWAAWDAKSPAEQVRDVVAADAAFLDVADRLSDDERGRWRLDLFGMDLDLAAFLRMRLSEHTLHSWDIAVALDPAKTLPDDAVGYVVDGLGMLAERVGRPHDRQVSVEVRTTAPERAIHLDLGPDGARLSPSYDDTAAQAELTLPAEAFVRLVYGRLDPEHTPASVVAKGVDLDLLRDTFPGV